MIMLKPIGKIYSPHKIPEGSPIQPSGASGMKGRVELLPEYEEGLADIEGFERIILIYLFHLSHGFSLKVIPFLDTRERGLFATRAPARPNPIGISVVTVLSVDRHVIHVENIDIVDGTPLIDIKPYVPQFDAFVDSKSGWFEHAASTVKDLKADRRFIK